MHANAALMERLFTGLDQHDHQAMAACYHADATFTDIAFDLRGQKQIHAMWHMISEGDIRTKFEILHADDTTGQANIVDDYTLTSTGRSVHNPIDSQFRFQDGLIIEQRDLCDAGAWSAMALGGPIGFLAGRFRFLRGQKARQILSAFVAEHPEYQ
jgi:ketosteroid isomerase-like protein